VGAGRRPGVFYNTGHGHLGWTLSAATAQAVSEKIAVDMPFDLPAVGLREAA
jgi:D-amino-acid dehydrogenase